MKASSRGRWPSSTYGARTRRTSSSTSVPRSTSRLRRWAATPASSGPSARSPVGCGAELDVVGVRRHDEDAFGGGQRVVRHRRAAIVAVGPGVARVMVVATVAHPRLGPLATAVVRSSPEVVAACGLSSVMVIGTQEVHASVQLTFTRCHPGRQTQRGTVLVWTSAATATTHPTPTATRRAHRSLAHTEPRVYDDVIHRSISLRDRQLSRRSRRVGT